MVNSNASPLSRSKFQGIDLSTLKIPSFVWILGLFGVFWISPAPAGLDVKTWHLFSIFVVTIVSIIANVLPMGALSIIALTLCCVTKTLTIHQALSAFSSNIIWLILIAFLLARGFIKTGLGARIAYYFVLNMGKSAVGLAYGLITTEFLLAPFTPSNTARGAGILYPIIHALSKEYQSTPQNGTERKIGAYLMKIGYQANVITSAIFLTATAGNPLIVSLAAKLGVDIGWTTWALAAIIPGIANLALLPWIVHLFYPPEITHTPQAPQFARQKLSEMGPLTTQEWIMLGTFALLLTLWVLGATLQIDATVAALVGLSILLTTKVLTWEDILQESNAWHTFIWLTTLLMMTNHLAEFGMVTWFSNAIQSWVNTLPWITALAVIALVYFYTHYAFASMTAHISSMYSAFVVVAIAAGAPPVMVVLLLAFLSSLCAGITHYGTGSAPVYFGSGYIKLKDWWRIGGILSLINIAIWTAVGSVWWALIGLW